MNDALRDLLYGPFAGTLRPRLWPFGPTFDEHGPTHHLFARSRWHWVRVPRGRPWTFYRKDALERLLDYGFHVGIRGYVMMGHGPEPTRQIWLATNPPSEARLEELHGDFERNCEGGVTYLVEVHRDAAYVGNVEHAWTLMHLGIMPELRSPESRVCSIGWCAREQKWYGWSHRAMYGFGVGDVVKEGDCTAASGWIEGYEPEDDPALPVGFRAECTEDAKRMAIAFAESVS